MLYLVAFKSLLAFSEPCSCSGKVKPVKMLPTSLRGSRQGKEGISTGPATVAQLLFTSIEANEKFHELTSFHSQGYRTYGKQEQLFP
jgi:hypothetical protein